MSAPASVTNATLTNTGLLGFNEQQGVLLTDALSVNGGTIAAGTRVDSHMIFLNKPSNLGGTLTHTGVDWTFSGQILGVMIDVNGLDEAASTSILGAMGTTYETFNNRGLESNDAVVINGMTLTTSFRVTQPGDWIRVITVSEVPIPAALPLFLSALTGGAFFTRKKKRNA